MIWILTLSCLLGAPPAGLRWLRVAQREHYLAPAVSRFAVRWWTNGATNLLLAGASVLGVAGTLFSPWWGLLVAVAQIGPVGLSVKGRSSPLAWTARLKRLAVTAGSLLLAAFIIGSLLEIPLVVVMALLALPVLIDLSLVLLGPVERRLGQRWVSKASAKLAASQAQVVAITGSYGKTTTKAYLAHLLGGRLRTVASPASFNNQMGLARAINEQLTPGTEVFVAEMGTYGPGEIAALCRWIRPTVAAIVSIGPVHLERFGTEENIVRAKAEIFDGAAVAVISVDHPLLETLATEKSREMTVITTSTKELADVSLDRGDIKVHGQFVGPMPQEVFAGNLLVAVAIADFLGVEGDHLSQRLHNLPSVQHRQTLSVSGSGVTVIDDTYNSNPAGADAALDLLDRTAGKQKAVVTPGMVELGPRQFEANHRFARRVGEIADHLVVVGNTNRRALLEGSANGQASVTVLPTRDEAVSWVRSNLGPGDMVLYENDLPDHYP